MIVFTFNITAVLLCCTSATVTLLDLVGSVLFLGGLESSELSVILSCILNFYCKCKAKAFKNEENAPN